MRNMANLALAAALFLAAGCGNSFYDANDYFTGPVSGVGLKPATSIVSGESERLSAVVIPVKTANRSVTWASSDSSIAAVDQNGLVTGVAVIPHGTTKQAVITVTTAEGNFSAQCAVTVVEKPVPVTGIALNKGASYLLTGNSEILVATVYPSDATNQNITWTSSNSLIASVDSSGVVITGTNTGTVVITVTTADGGYTASCQFTVTATPVPVTGVTLNKSSTVTAIGNSETLFATIAPLNATNQNLIWTSSNPGVAAVSAQGNVTGTGEGTAAITVATADGNFTAQCAVTVTAMPVAVAGIDLVPSSITVLVGNQGELTATILPSNATNQNLTWMSSNNLVASVDSSGVVTGVSPGSAVITVTTQDGGYSKTCAAVIASAVTYTVSYDGNWATSGTAPQALSYLPGVTVVVMNSGTLTMTGHAFAGWNTVPGGTGTSYAPGASFIMPPGPVILYAQWTLVPAYTVAYDANGGTGTVPATASYLPGDQVVVAGGSGLVNAGYTFAGWNTNQGGTGILHPANTTFTMGNSPVILYAMWTAVPLYSVMYIESGSTSGTVPVDGKSYVTGDTVIVLDSGDLRGVAIADGITQRFTGWNTKYNGTGNAYAPGSPLIMGTSDVILYAQWTTDGGVIGKRGPAGGYVFYAKAGYDDSPLGDGFLWRYLEAAPYDQGLAQWGCEGSEIPGDQYFPVGAGYQNTLDILSACLAPGIGARVCNDLDLNGYSDWFMPSLDEMTEMYTKLKLNNIGGFGTDSYWSSTEYWWPLPTFPTDFYGLVIQFSDSYTYYGGKSSLMKIRAARRF